MLKYIVQAWEHLPGCRLRHRNHDAPGECEDPHWNEYDWTEYRDGVRREARAVVQSADRMLKEMALAGQLMPWNLDDLRGTGTLNEEEYQTATRETLNRLNAWTSTNRHREL